MNFLQINNLVIPNIDPNTFRMRLFDQLVANMYLSLIKSESVAVVQRVQTKEKKKTRPQALNTVEMLRVASSNLGMGPHATMQVSFVIVLHELLTQPGA